MAMDGDRLGAVIADLVQSQKPADGSQVSPGQLADLWKSIATAIITEITTNSQIVVTTPNTINGTGVIS